MRERIEAMKAIWAQAKPKYSGELVKFDEMMQWPKPVQKPHPPIIVGGGFPQGAAPRHRLRRRLDADRRPWRRHAGDAAAVCEMLKAAGRGRVRGAGDAVRRRHERRGAEARPRRRRRARRLWRSAGSPGQGPAAARQGGRPDARRMIVDCHAHVFAHWIGACGHPTRDLHNRYLQRMITRTAASTFRARDRARADTQRAVPRRRCRLERAHRRRFPGRPFRPARVHPRGRRPRHPVHAGRHAGDGGATRADAGADDVCRRRSLPAAGGRRLRGDDGDERLRPASVPRPHDRADACRRGDGGQRARACQGRPCLPRAAAPRSLLQRRIR